MSLTWRRKAADDRAAIAVMTSSAASTMRMIALRWRLSDGDDPAMNTR
jgi:hypothetical protein